MMSFDNLWNVMKKKEFQPIFCLKNCTFKVDLGSNALAI